MVHFLCLRISEEEVIIVGAFIEEDGPILLSTLLPHCLTLCFIFLLFPYRQGTIISITWEFT